MPYKFNPFTGNLDLVDTNTAAGSDTQIQYNSSGVLAGSADLTWDDSAKELGVGGDINLDDGGTYETTVQVVTPTANRTISFPDATGTVALVAGSSGQLTYNDAGAQAGLTSASIGSTGQINISLAGAASTPPVSFTGSWFTGGTATTTKPQLLIEPTGTTSTAWSTSGTGLGVNAASGFSGRLLDLQLNGTSSFSVNSSGTVSVPLGSNTAPSVYFGTDTNTGLYSPGADQVAISTNGTGRLFIDASGNVGVGASFGGDRTVNVRSTGATRGVLSTNGASGEFRIGATNDSSTGNLVFQTGASLAERLKIDGNGTTTLTAAATTTPFIVKISSSEVARIDSSGRLGLGTSSPAEVLDVSGNIAFGASFAGRIFTKNAGGGYAAGTVEISAPNETTTRGVSFGNNYYITASNTYAQTATNIGGSAIEFRANNINYGEILFRQKQDPDAGGAERIPMFISTAGNVGIGTTSVSNLLHLRSDSASNVDHLYLQNRNGGANSGARIAFSNGTNDYADNRYAYIGAINTGASESGNHLVFATNANGGSPSEKARLDSSGRLLVGTSSGNGLFNGGTQNPRLQIEGTTGDTIIASLTANRNDAAGPTFYLAHSRGTAAGGTTVLQSGDQLGVLAFAGTDGTDYVNGATITANVDGTPGANDMPGRLVFSTTADGAATPTERLRITSDAYVRLASGTGGIQFNGDTAAANALDDYEEGTWTPALAGSTTAGTYETSFASGWYTKIGRQVTVQFRINLAGSVTGGGVGFAVITGLPFNSSTDNYANGGSVLLSGVDFNDSAKHLYLYKRSTTSAQLVISEVFDNASAQDVGIADFAASSIVAGSLIYFIS
jgi:hypothetical protein